MTKVTKKGLMNDLSIKRCIFFISINCFVRAIYLPALGETIHARTIAVYNGT